MYASWVHEDNMPSMAIAEFDSGVTPEVHIHRESSCNQLSFTATVSTPTDQSANPQKRRKVQRWTSPNNSG